MTKVLKFVKVKCGNCGFLNLIPASRTFTIIEPIKFEKCGQGTHDLNILFNIALRGSSQTLKRAYLIHLIVLFIFIVYGFSLLFIDIDPNVFLTFVFSGYFILGVIFGVIFRKRFLSGSVTAFPLTFLSWVIAFVLFLSFSGVTGLVQAFSEGFQNVLIAGLFFSTITFVAVLLTAMVPKLFQFVSKRIKKNPVNLRA